MQSVEVFLSEKSVFTLFQSFTWLEQHIKGKTIDEMSKLVYSHGNIESGNSNKTFERKYKCT